MPELVLDDVTLHVEVDGDGEPVTVLGHGLTNSCQELAQLTPFTPGTKVRFCFRGHGHSSSPAGGYRFADFARDLRAVADAYGATIGMGTSLGAGALAHLVAGDPDRFQKLIFLLPAALDPAFRYRERLLRTAVLLDGESPEEAIEAVLRDPERLAALLEGPWTQNLDRSLPGGLDPMGLPRAIREIIDDVPLRDREDLRAVAAPALVICCEGDPLHPAEVGRILCEVMPNAQLMMFGSAAEMFDSVPRIVARVGEFLASTT